MQGTVLALFRFSRLLARGPRALRWSVTSIVGCELALLVCASLAMGQTTIDWTNSSGGPYELSTNWIPANVPDQTSENARFALPAAYDVTFIQGSNTTVSDLLVEDGSVTFASDGVTPATYTINDDTLIQAAVLALSQAGGSGDMTLAINDDLDVHDGGTLNVLEGSDVEVAGLLSVGTDLDQGVVLVSGTGSSLNVTGTGKHTLGQMGHMGTLTFDDHSTGNSIDGSLLLTGGTTPATRSILEVLDGSDLTLGNLSMGVGTQGGGSVLLGLQFADGDPVSIKQVGASTLTIGGTAVSSHLSVFDEGTFTTGTGQITVNSDSFLIIHGTFNANANVLLDGGQIIVTSTDFNLGAGRVVTAQNGGQIVINNDYQFDDGTTFEITDGAVLDSFGDPDWTVGNATDGTVIVDGSSGPSLMILKGGDLSIGSGAGAGVVTVREGATALMRISDEGGGGFFGDLSVGSDSNGTGVLNVIAGGDFDAGAGIVTINETGLVDINNGTFNVAGDIIIAGGELRRRAGDFVWADGQTMTISDGGLIDFTGEEFVLPANATVEMKDGTVVMSQLTIDPTATLTFNPGTLHDTDDLTLSPNDGLANIHHLTFGMTLIVEGETTLNSTLLTIDGGTFSTGSLANPEFLDFRRGTFNLNGEDLTIGGGGVLGATVVLPFGKNINTNTVNVAVDGLLSLQGGQLSGDTINNSGHIDMATASSTLIGGKVNNTGLISGEGRITAVMNNQSGGEIRVTTGEQLRLTAASNSNDGQISLFGGTAEFTQDLINNAAGVITGQGSLIVSGGLTNNGALSFGGTTNIDGNVTNNGSGVITASGGSTTNFFDDLVNNGELAIGTSSFATIFGTLSGGGIVTGDGTLIIEGQFNPGMSPAAVEVATDLQLGADAVLQIELGGLDPGTQYDQVHVAGQVELGGQLSVAAIDGLLPEIGDTFEIITYSSLSGTFDQVVFAGGLRGTLDVGPSSMTFAITAVPEPATVMLLLAGLVVVIGVRCRRAGL